MHCSLNVVNLCTPKQTHVLFKSTLKDASIRFEWFQLMWMHSQWNLMWLDFDQWFNFSLQRSTSHWWLGLLVNSLSGEVRTPINLVAIQDFIDSISRLWLFGCQWMFQCRAQVSRTSCWAQVPRTSCWAQVSGTSCWAQVSRVRVLRTSLICVQVLGRHCMCSSIEDIIGFLFRAGSMHSKWHYC